METLPNVRFINKGALDIAAITLFGASVKECSNPIGYFGTGLKYALATLVRNKQRVIVRVADVAYSVIAQAVTVRSVEFQEVMLQPIYENSDAATVKLGFTTALGKDWELWMAYRELYCNCMDEGGLVDMLGTEEGDALLLSSDATTSITVSGDEFAAVHIGRDEFILPIARLGDPVPSSRKTSVEIFRKESKSFFYRGIRVLSFQLPTLYTYNHTTQLALTEDRSVKSHGTMVASIAEAIAASNDANFLRVVLTAPRETTFEGQLDYQWHTVVPSDTFCEVVAQLANDSATKINGSALQLWRQRFPAAFHPRRAELNASQQLILEQALELTESMGFPITTSEFSVHICESLGPGTMGLAIDGAIYIAIDVFNSGGVRLVAGTLIEEYAHLRFGFNDCSRALQNFLLDRLVSMGAERHELLKRSSDAQGSQTLQRLLENRHRPAAVPVVAPATPSNPDQEFPF